MDRVPKRRNTALIGGLEEEVETANSIFRVEVMEGRRRGEGATGRRHTFQTIALFPFDRLLHLIQFRAEKKRESPEQIIRFVKYAKTFYPNSRIK